MNDTVRWPVSPEPEASVVSGCQAMAVTSSAIGAFANGLRSDDRLVKADLYGRREELASAVLAGLGISPDARAKRFPGPAVIGYYIQQEYLAGPVGGEQWVWIDLRRLDRVDEEGARQKLADALKGFTPSRHYRTLRLVRRVTYTTEMVL